MPRVRKIKKVNVKFVSLCARGKNGLGVLYKSDGQDTIELQSLCKMTEQGHLLSVVYPANRLDADLMFADSSVCQEMCDSHAENGLQLDIHHDGRVLSKADIFVAENFIIQQGDPRFQNWTNADGTPAGDLTGGWAQRYVIKSELLRQQYREGKWNGVSLAGPALLEEVEVAKSGETAPPQPQPQEPKMDPIQIQAMIQKSVADAVAAANAPKPLTLEDVQKCVSEAIAKSNDKKDEPKPRKRSAIPEPILKSYDPESIQKFNFEVSAKSLVEGIQKAKTEGDTAEVLALGAELETLQKAMQESGLFEKPDDEHKARTGLARGARSSTKNLAKGVREKLGEVNPVLLALAADENHLSEDGGDPIADLLKGMDDETYEALNGEPKPAETATA